MGVSPTFGINRCGRDTFLDAPCGTPSFAKRTGKLPVPPFVLRASLPLSQSPISHLPCLRVAEIGAARLPSHGSGQAGRGCADPKDSPLKAAVAFELSPKRLESSHGPPRKVRPPHEGVAEIGAARFELTTSCSQSRRSTRLSYAPYGRHFGRVRSRIKEFRRKSQGSLRDTNHQSSSIDRRPFFQKENLLEIAGGFRVK